MTLSKKHTPVCHPRLSFEHTVVQEVSTHKHIGLTLSENFSWSPHIDECVVKARKPLNVMHSLKY